MAKIKKKLGRPEEFYWDCSMNIRCSKRWKDKKIAQYDEWKAQQRYSKSPINLSFSAWFSLIHCPVK